MSQFNSSIFKEITTTTPVTSARTAVSPWPACLTTSCCHRPVSPARPVVLVYVTAARLSSSCDLPIRGQLPHHSSWWQPPRTEIPTLHHTGRRCRGCRPQPGTESPGGPLNWWSSLAAPPTCTDPDQPPAVGHVRAESTNRTADCH